MTTNLGFIYWKQGELGKALEYIELGLEFFHKFGDKIRLGTSYANLGKIYFERNENEKALNNLKSAKEYLEEIEDVFEEDYEDIREGMTGHSNEGDYGSTVWGDDEADCNGDCDSCGRC